MALAAVLHGDDLRQQGRDVLGEVLAGLGGDDHVEIAELAASACAHATTSSPLSVAPEPDAEPAAGVHLRDRAARATRSSRTIVATRRAASSTIGIDSVM